MSGGRKQSPSNSKVATKAGEKPQLRAEKKIDEPSTRGEMSCLGGVTPGKCNVSQVLNQQMTLICQ